MNITNSDYFTFNAHNSLLLVGKSGSGKSHLVRSLISKIQKSHKPEKTKFVIFDLKRVEFLTDKDIDKDYLLQDVIYSTEEGLKVLNSLVAMAEQRAASQGDKMPQIFVYIEECDMAVADNTQFNKSIIQLNSLALRSNMKIVYSTSRFDEMAVSDELLQSFELMLVGRSSDEHLDRLGLKRAHDTSEPHGFMVLEQANPITQY